MKTWGAALFINGISESSKIGVPWLCCRYEDSLKTIMQKQWITSVPALNLSWQFKSWTFTMPGSRSILARCWAPLPSPALPRASLLRLQEEWGPTSLARERRLCASLHIASWGGRGGAFTATVARTLETGAPQKLPQETRQAAVHRCLALLLSARRCLLSKRFWQVRFRRNTLKERVDTKQKSLISG